MRQIYKIASKNPLFRGISQEDFSSMCNCLCARVASYPKDAVLLLTGDAVREVGLVLSGTVRILKEDVGGKVSMMTELDAPELFGEVFACAEVDNSPVTVQAKTNCQVLFLNYRKIITICPSACPFHTGLIENMLRLLAQKTLLLNQKTEILSKRTTREKLLCFFDVQRRGARAFTVPYNREAMANYLCVDRSAMSHELSKLRDEGLIRFHKNEFEVLYD